LDEEKKTEILMKRGTRSMDQNIDWDSVLLGEKLVFDLCGRILYDTLDRVWLQSLIDEDIFAEAPFAGSREKVQAGLKYLQAWASENKSGISDQAFLNLQTDYTRLFVGIVKVLVPVWESVYFNQDRMVFQEETLNVRKWYRRFGLEPEKLHQEPDDHIGLELQFMAHLAGLGLNALEQKDEVSLQKIIEAQRGFLSEHLLRFVFKWQELLEENARTDFYRGVGLLVVGSLLETAQLVGAKYPPEIIQ
jgi:TorA maturation chaperone TorD